MDRKLYGEWKEHAGNTAKAHDPGDGRIMSNDDKAREKFARIPDERVARIHWARASLDTVRWLKDGAPANDALRLRPRPAG